MVIVCSIQPSRPGAWLCPVPDNRCSQLGLGSSINGDWSSEENLCSIKQDYRPEGQLIEMQAQEILTGVNICLYYTTLSVLLPFDQLTGSLHLCSSMPFPTSKLTFSGVLNDVPCRPAEDQGYWNEVRSLSMVWCCSCRLAFPSLYYIF